MRISFLYLMTVTWMAVVSMRRLSWGISSKYDVFAMLSATSMANALAAITAQNMGAGKPEGEKISWYGLSFALGVSLLFWLWAQMNPQSMIGVFSKDANVIAAGIPFFKSCSYDYIMVAMVFCLNGYLNGKEKTFWTMVGAVQAHSSCVFLWYIILACIMPVIWVCWEK